MIEMIKRDILTQILKIDKQMLNNLLNEKHIYLENQII